MSLCRYLPTPSDRMGILWSLLNVGQAAVIEFGPTGTTHFSAGFLGKIGVDPNNRLFATHMQEDDVIMGYTETLEDAIQEIDELIKPKLIFVVASSVSAIIGTDLKGVCTAVQPNVNAKLYALENGGFRGDYTIGIKSLYENLFKDIIKGKEKSTIDNTYNILGASSYSYRMKSDINEIKALMKDSFNYNVISTLCVDTNEEAIVNSINAKINLVLSKDALPLANYMKDVYGVPYIYGAPYGYNGTDKWLKEVSEIIQAPINNEIIHMLMERKMSTKHYAMYKMMLKNHKPTVSIYSEHDRIVGFTAIANELGFIIDSCVSSHNIKDIDDEKIIVLEKEKDRIDLFKSKNNQLILSDDITLRIVNGTNTTLRISMPLIYGSQVANHIPLVGIRGMDYFLETVDKYIQTLN